MTSPMDDDKYLDLPRLAAYSCLAVPTLREYLKSEDLPHFKLRGKILVKRSEFDEWIKSYRIDGGDVSKAVDEILRALDSN